MERKLPLYIFIRNSIILCVLFLIVSILIIEHRKQLQGGESLFSRKSSFDEASLTVNKSDINSQNSYIIY